jgi:hypothetical protein
VRTKVCRRCAITKDVSQFNRNARRPDGFALYCRDCYRHAVRMSYFGITAERHAAMMAAQGGRCAVCRVRQEDRRLSFAVDHDHRCCPGEKSCGECVRALICDGCNRGLGFLGDDPDRLRAAASYLESFARA